MTARYRIEVNEDCISSGSCLGMAPKFFEDADEGGTRPRLEVVDADPLVMDAAECCPMEAIVVYDATTGERLYPEPY